jgi:hypothetical protein
MTGPLLGRRLVYHERPGSGLCSMTWPVPTDVHEQILKFGGSWLECNRVDLCLGTSPRSYSMTVGRIGTAFSG